MNDEAQGNITQGRKVKHTNTYTCVFTNISTITTHVHASQHTCIHHNIHASQHTSINHNIHACITPYIHHNIHHKFTQTTILLHPDIMRKKGERENRHTCGCILTIGRRIVHKSIWQQTSQQSSAQPRTFGQRQVVMKGHRLQRMRQRSCQGSRGRRHSCGHGHP